MSSELKVGVFALLAIVAAVYFGTKTSDNPFKKQGLNLQVRMASAEGLSPGSRVETAGVRIGVVDHIDIVDGAAVAHLTIKPGYDLPVDSSAIVAKRGLLGDTIVKVSAGASETLLGEGDVMRSGRPATGLPELQDKLSFIADDIKVITGSLRSMMGSDQLPTQINDIMGNLERFTAELNSVSRANRSDIDRILSDMQHLTESLALLTDRLGPEVESEMGQVRAATGTLQDSLEHMKSITDKVDRGQGTLGRLVNEDDVIDDIGDTVHEMGETLQDVGELVSGLSRFQFEVYYRGEVYFQPNLQPFHISAKNLIGLRVKPRPDYWYQFEFVDDPEGRFTEETFYRQGDITETYTEVRRINKMQFSFQFAKRFRDLVLRIGIKENTGALGVDWFLANDHIELAVDVYDFPWASWPDRTGVPNLRLGANLYPIEHVYFTAGVDNLVNNIIHKRPAFFIGGGVSFTDNDLKWIVGSVPLGAL